MARQRKKEPKVKDMKLKQPDRSGPTDNTLLDFAQQRDLFAEAAKRERELKRERGELVEESDEEDEDEGPPVLSPRAERILEAALYTITLAMMHFTFDVLVHHQYGKDIEWPVITRRAVTAWAVFLVVFYPLHHHEANPRLMPGLPMKYQTPLRQFIFFVTSVVCGCYLILISNTHGYLAVMKQAPPLGCLWIWAVVELELLWAVLSLSLAGGYLWLGDYSVY